MSVRVAILGTGNAARHHVTAVRMTANMQIEAISGRDAGRAHEFARQFCPGCNVLSFEDALRSPAVDAVILAVAPAAQTKLAVAAFENGRHVLCEKPLAPSLADAQRIESAWRSSGKVGMVNFCYRLIPEIAAFKSELNSGNWGSLNFIQVEWILSSRLNTQLARNWKTDPESGGGVLQNFGSHVIDYLFHDVPRVEILAARQGNALQTGLEGPAALQAPSADDVATVFFDIPGLCPAIMHLSLVSRPALGHRLTARGTLRTLEVHNSTPVSPAGPFSIKWSPVGGGEGECGPTRSPHSGNEAYDLALLFKRVLANFEQAITTKSSSYGPDISSGVHAARMIHEIQLMSRQASWASARPM